MVLDYQPFSWFSVSDMKETPGSQVFKSLKNMEVISG
jgi:hypothetical protein